MFNLKIGPGLEMAIVYIKVSPTPTFIFNDIGECVHINDSAISFLGYEINDLDEGKIFTFVKDTEKDKVKAALKKEIANPYSLTVITKNKDEKHVDANGVTVIYDENKYRFSTMTDRTEITIKKKELEEMNKKHLQNLNTIRFAAISDITKDLAHQWRQPLSVACTSITGIATMLRYNMYNDKEILSIPDDLDNVDRVLQNLSKIIDDFNSLSVNSKTKSNILLSEVFNDAYNVLRSSINRLHISLNTDYCTSKSLYTFKNEIRQVFAFLLKNSEDAFLGKNIEKPKIYVEIKEDNLNQIFTIRDNAGGIDESIISKIFEPYFTTKHKKEGIGLALYQTKEIIEKLLNGKITVENVENGAKFTITIPYE